ncbi:hypothetical protein F5050DRAFT_1807559 [Lentinula boryana]|uniref:DUF6533 domain-containing protein n=1 Tax=Lentinula boryana TaxID=40481 RepID=A0ABQ8QDT9_9AGAR|nr:hypothetical protein F5050DRAFT_1807559 [Lentinula boryana]
MASPLAIIAQQPNYVCSLLVTKDQIGALPVGTGYVVQLANPLNNTDVFAQSSPYEIKAAGSAYPSTTVSPESATFTPSSSGSTSSATASSTSEESSSNDAFPLKASLSAFVPLTVVGFPALLYYDYFLTLGEEVNLFWSYRSLTWATIIFYVTRYFSILGSIPVMVGHFWLGHVAVFIGVLLLLRTYALYERNFKVLVLLVVVGLALLIFGISVLAWGRNEIQFQATVVVSNELGCQLWLNQQNASCLALIWGGMLLFDFLVFSLTLYKALTLQRDGRVTLLSVLMRDGTVYFGVMAISIIANILTFMVSPVLLSPFLTSWTIFQLGIPETRGMATTFTNSISSIMISRLMFNLRNPGLSRILQHPTTPSLRPPALPYAAVATLDSLQEESIV